MGNGFGPYGVITSGEVVATLLVLLTMMSAMLWMAYGTRRRVV